MFLCEIPCLFLHAAATHWRLYHPPTYLPLTLSTLTILVHPWPSTTHHLSLLFIQPLYICCWWNHILYHWIRDVLNSMYSWIPHPNPYPPLISSYHPPPTSSPSHLLYVCLFVCSVQTSRPPHTYSSLVFPYTLFQIYDYSGFTISSVEYTFQ